MRPKTIMILALIVIALLTAHKPIGTILETFGHVIHQTGQVVKTGHSSG